MVLHAMLEGVLDEKLMFEFVCSHLIWIFEHVRYRQGLYGALFLSGK